MWTVIHFLAHFIEKMRLVLLRDLLNHNFCGIPVLCSNFLEIFMITA